MPKDKREKRRKELVKPAAEMIGKWQVLLGLTQWSIDVSIYSDKHDNCGMYTSWEPGYRNARISINERLQKEGDDVGFERMIVHELTHLLTAPIEDWFKANFHSHSPIGLEVEQRMETIVDSTSNIFRKLYDLVDDDLQ